MKIAVLQVCDTGPLESLVVMLRSAGYQCYLPNDSLKSRFRFAGCDTVLDVKGLVDNWGYDQPMPLPLADSDILDKCDLYVDIKAHRNGPKLWNKWPRLQGRTLWYRINGGEPEHVIRNKEDFGDERNPPCPVLTPNLWYREPGPWQAISYACWPPFYRFNDYYALWVREPLYFSDPICLTHNLVGWGYGELIDRCVSLGVRCYGNRSPQGLISHKEIPKLLSHAKCLVHLKTSDAPGYSLYEALAAACPLVVSRSLIWRNKMGELFEPGVTCLAFDKPTHADCDVDSCQGEIKAAIEQLSDPEENRRIGMAGKERLQALLWNVERDGHGLSEFLRKCFHD